MKYLIYFLLFLFSCSFANAQQVKTFWSNGNEKEKATLKNGLKDGKWQEFYESGKLKYKGKYKKGKFGLYDGELNGFHESGKKWFHIIYSSEERTEYAEEWNENGKLIRTTKVQYITKPALSFKMTSITGNDTSLVDMEKQKIHWTTSDDKNNRVVYELNSNIKKFKKEKKHEVIKSLLFDVAANNSALFLKQLNTFYDSLKWEGHVSLKDSNKRAIADTTYVDNLPRYFFEYVYMSDSLAYSKTIMDNKVYYIFPSSCLQYIQKIMRLVVYKDSNGNNTGQYSDYIELPVSFPDGTWLFLYSKDKKQFIQDNYEFLRRKVNDTIYQYSNYNIVLFSQEYKEHKANGAFNTYYFYSASAEHMNQNLPVKADKYKPLQFNIQQQYGLYKDGQKDGVFYRFLLDGKTEISCNTFKNNIWNGITIYYDYDQTLTKQILPFITYSEIYLDSEITNKKVDIDFPRNGYFTRYIYVLTQDFDKYGKKGNYVSLSESYLTHAPIGIELKIEDTITNLQNVITKNKAKCKYYSEIFHDENGTVTKYQIYRYGKLKRYGYCKSSPVWTQDPEKIKTEEYDDNGILIESNSFDYIHQTITTTTYKKGVVIKVEKGKM